jgi:hypothetical protein
MARELAAAMTIMAVGGGMMFWALGGFATAIAVLVCFGVLGPVFILATLPDDDDGRPAPDRPVEPPDA